MKPIKISSNKTIRSHFSNNKEVLICLYPFENQIFANHYNWEANLKFSYPLLSTIKWSEISKGIGFKSLNRLAKGILELQEPFKTELIEFCELKKIETPDYASDRIPSVVFIPLIQYLLKKKNSAIKTLKVDRFPDSEFKIIKLDNRNEFEIYYEVMNAKVLIMENGIGILIPDYDCPYFIISGSKVACIELVESCKLEYLNTNNDTKFDWWNHGKEH